MNVFSQVSTFGKLCDSLDHGPHHFLAGGVAQGMDDAVVAVPPFAAQRQLPASSSKCAPQCDQLANPLRRFADDHLDDSPDRTSRRRRASVSATWFSKRSSGSSTPAMPPWA